MVWEGEGIVVRKLVNVKSLINNNNLHQDTPILIYLVELNKNVLFSRFTINLLNLIQRFSLEVYKITSTLAFTGSVFDEDVGRHYNNRLKPSKFRSKIVLSHKRK